MWRVVDQSAIHGPVEGGRGVASEIDINENNKDGTQYLGHSVWPIKQRKLTICKLIHISLHIILIIFFFLLINIILYDL